MHRKVLADEVNVDDQHEKNVSGYELKLIDSSFISGVRIRLAPCADGANAFLFVGAAAANEMLNRLIVSVGIAVVMGLVDMDVQVRFRRK